MFNSALSILYLILSICIVFLTIFLCILLYNLIIALKRINRVIKPLETAIIKVENFLDNLKKKLTFSSLKPTLLLETVDRVIEFIKKNAPHKTTNKKKTKK